MSVIWLVLAALGVLMLTVMAGEAIAFGWMHLQFTRLHAREGWETPTVPWSPGLAWVEHAAIWRMVRWGLVSRRDDGIRGDPSSNPGPVHVLIHGYGVGPENVFGLRQELEARGARTVSLDLGRPFHNVEFYRDRALTQLDAVLAQDAPDAPFVLVGFSMGGIIARMMLQARPDLAARVHAFATIGTPHRGTGAAHGPVTLGEDAKALRRDSALLADLPRMHELTPHARRLTFGAARDYVVYPRETAFEPDSETVVFDTVGHGGLATDPTVLRAIAQRLTEDAPA